MKLAAARAVERTVGAKPCGFRPYLGNRCAIPTFPPPRRLLDCFLNSNPERSFPQPSAQASFRHILRLEKTERNAGTPTAVEERASPRASFRLRATCNHRDTEAQRRTKSTTDIHGFSRI